MTRLPSTYPSSCGLTECTGKPMCRRCFALEPRTTCHYAEEIDGVLFLFTDTFDRKGRLERRDALRSNVIRE